MTDGLATWTPARAPAGETIAGARVRLEPLNAERHGDALFLAAQGDDADPRLWDYMGYGPFADAAAFRAWARDQQDQADPRYYAVVLAATGQPQGVASYLRIEPGHGVIEIGHIWFGTQLQQTAAATEAIFLLARHAFDELGYRRLEWKCDARNDRSQAAARRFGFTYEGTFRQHMVIKGANRDTAWYAILDRDWPAIRTAFEAWLAPANFDEHGRQRTPLDARSQAAASPVG